MQIPSRKCEVELYSNDEKKTVIPLKRLKWNMLHLHEINTNNLNWAPVTNSFRKDRFA